MKVKEGAFMEISKGNYILNQVFLNFNTFMYKKQVTQRIPVFSMDLLGMSKPHL